MRIVIATDGSPVSTKAAREGARLAATMQEPPRIVLLAVDPPLMKSVAVALGPDGLAKYHADNMRFAMKGAGAALRRAKVGYEEASMVGDPAESILRFCAKEKADLLVMGSHGRGAAKSLLLGSVTMKVLAGGTVPTLVVR